MTFEPLTVPILIICRDKVAPLAELVQWLERHRYERIILVDNASTYPPLLEFFARTPHEVVRLSENFGPHRSIWGTNVREQYIRGRYYVVTDSDVVPDTQCPGDAVEYFHWALNRFPSFAKAGFGLHIDDLPEHNELAETIRRREYWFWVRRFSLNLYQAPIDTTFALYRPDSAFTLRPAIRTGAPYLARHQPWYIDSKNRTEEEAYYRDHCDPGVAHWDLDGHSIPRRRTPGSVLKAKAQWRIHVHFRLQQDRAVPKRYRTTVEST
jgi:hypothetical protein